MKITNASMLSQNVIASRLKAVAKQSPIAMFAFAFLFAACSENETSGYVTNINQTGVDVVASVDELPKCQKDNEGYLVFVKGENSARICIDGKWFATKDSSNVGDFNCTTKELKDGSGLKIICNGDSIGVVLNGSDGKNGTKGDPGEAGKNGDDGASCAVEEQTDSTVVINCGGQSMTLNLGAATVRDSLEPDSEMIAISLDTLSGVSQKGPFLKGSTVFLYELSDGRTLKQTNGNFVSNITSDDGRFRFTTRNLMSQYALIVVDGKYRNEVTGDPTNTSIRLQAYTDVLNRKNANVNLLTQLEMNRVYYLVTHEKKRFKVAKHQAQMEILDAFYIDTTGINKSSEDLNVFGNTEADAALLAISILLQGDSNETALSVLLTEIADDMESDGQWNDSATRARIAEWAAIADTAGKLAEFRSHVKGWKLGGGNVPDFEKYIRKFWSKELGLGVCDGKNNPIGIVKNVSNKKSDKYYAATYTDVSKTAVRFICVDADSIKWRPATDIEKDTMGWASEFKGAKDGDVHNGKVNSTKAYVFQGKKWRTGTNLDSLFVYEAGGVACIGDEDTSTVKYLDFQNPNDSVYYVCTPNTNGVARSWVKAPIFYNDTYEARKECSKNGKYGDGTILVGRINADHKYVCDNGEFRTLDTTEIKWNRGCVSYIHGTSVMFDGQYSYYKCSERGWMIDFGKLNKDSITYEGQTYKTIGIKSQMWMAENLNYEVANSYCYDNYADSCAKYGRLYTWAAAVGKSEEECGYGKVCGLSGVVRGICPEGWHLPSISEWETLYAAVDSDPYALQAKGIEDWTSATDAYGFSALPAGFYDAIYFFEAGTNAFFWSSTEYDKEYAYYWYLYPLRAGQKNGYGKKYGRSVRCIMDAPAAP